MLTKTLLILAVLCTAILIGCGKTDTTNNSNTTTGDTKTTTASTPATTTATTSGDKIGVPECDDFIAKYEACITSSKVPEAVRGPFKSAVAQWRASWKKAAEDPTTKASLAKACKDAAAQQETALKPYGCTW